MTVSGTAAVVALAGCANSGPGGDNESDNETGDETYTLTVTVEAEDVPVEDATVTLEQAGMGDLGGEDGGTGTGSDNDTDGAMENESANETEAGGMENETEANGTGNETTTGGAANESENATDDEPANESDA